MNTQITAGRISRPVRRNEKAVQVDRPRRQIIQFNGRPLLLPTVCNLIQPKGRIHSPFTQGHHSHTVACPDTRRLQTVFPSQDDTPPCLFRQFKAIHRWKSAENQLQPDRIEKRAVVEHMDVLFHEQVIPVYRRVFSRQMSRNRESCKR